MRTIDEYHELVEDIYEKDEFVEEIQRRYEENAGYFKESTIAHMIVVEHDRDSDVVSKIKDLKQGNAATIEGKIVDLGTLRTFDSKRGSGKVRNVRIDDGSGSVKIVLWNDETDIVDSMEIGQDVRVINGYVQDKGYGLQISTGRWGKISLETKD